MKNSIKSRFSKEKIAKFFDREGFYIILFICVCIVAVTAVWVSRSGLKNNIQNLTDIKENKTSINTPSVSDNETLAKKDHTEVQVIGEVKTSKTDYKTSSDQKTAPAAVQKTATTVQVKFTAASPVDSEIKKDMVVRDYSPDKLVNFPYLNVWRAHLGIDLKMNEDTEVTAVADGKVIDVRNDNDFPGGLGWTVVIDHQNGYRSVYSNLGESLSVEKNQSVKKGQTIGVVKNTSIFEKDVSVTAGDPTPKVTHLHFELLKKNASNSYENVDPKQYLPMLE